MAGTPASSRGVTFAGARVKRAGAQTFTTGVQTSLTFDTEVFDTDGFHDNAVNPTRLTVPAGMGGTYLIGGSISWVGNATGIRALFVELNAGALLNICGVIQEPEAANAINQALATLYQLVAGDFVELRALQSSGGNLNDIVDEEAAPAFWLARLG